MLKITDANNFRRSVAGLSLIAAPLVGLIGALLTPQYTGDLGEELAAISAPGRWLVSDFLNLLTFFLMIPAVFGLLHLLRHRAVALGHIGAALALLGLFFHGAIIGFALVEVPLVESGLERAQMVAFAERMYEGPAFLMILAPFIGFYLGMIILAVALWRAKVAPLWVSVLLVAGLLSEFVGTDAVSPELMFVLLLISLGWLGLRVLRTPDAEWADGSAAALGSDRMVGEPAPAN
ncbi:MAG: hypothetical protein M3Q29_06755 [Chloroflexota bacterium]|nr:hypothetical protein [Chloroflexota bacterium]